MRKVLAALTAAACLTAAGGCSDDEKPLAPIATEGLSRPSGVTIAPMFSKDVLGWNRIPITATAKCGKPATSEPVSWPWTCGVAGVEENIAGIEFLIDLKTAHQVTKIVVAPSDDLEKISACTASMLRPQPVDYTKVIITIDSTCGGAPGANQLRIPSISVFGKPAE